MRKIKVIKSGEVLEASPVKVQKPVRLIELRNNWLRDARESISARHASDLQAFFGRNDAMRQSV